MTLGSNVDSRKPHHLTSFLHSVAPASEPELALLLVHARTPFAPLDTVRALSPGRGRQSSAQGFSTKRRTEAANATGLKSSRGNSACSAIAPTRPRPKHQTTSPFSFGTHTGGPRKRLSPTTSTTIRGYRNGHLRNRDRQDNQST